MSRSSDFSAHCYAELNFLSTMWQFDSEDTNSLEQVHAGPIQGRISGFCFAGTIQCGDVKVGTSSDKITS